MNPPTIDVLMITYNRPHYTERSLTQLLATCDESMRVWLWHNGEDKRTLEVVQSLAKHPRVHQFHVSKENKKLVEPTNWVWMNGQGQYVSKVDDDCILPMGWAQTLRDAHEDVPEFGVIGCWRFLEEDFIPELASDKIRTFGGKHRLFLNCWVQGSGYLMKRKCIAALGPLGTLGPLGKVTSFTAYCIQLALQGWINGFYYPFIREDHMDDPRSPNTALRTDEDFRRFLPLTAENRGVKTLDEWGRRVRENARYVLEAPVDPRWFVGWRRRLRAVSTRLHGLVRKSRA